MMHPDPFLALAYGLDPVMWVTDVLHVEPDGWQERILHADAPEIMVLASRQSGKSTCLGWLVAHLMLVRPGAVIVAVAPSMRQSSELIRGIRAALTAAGARLAVDNAHSLETDAGSRVIGLPGGEGGTGARGVSADLVCLDEASYIGMDVLAAVRPMIAARKGARIISISSAGVAGSSFHQRWIADLGEAVLKVEVKPEDIARYDASVLERDRAALGHRLWEKEYNNRFSTNGTGFFSSEAMDALYGSGEEVDDDDAVVGTRPALHHSI